MDKKLAGLLGAAAALTTMTAAKAAPAVGPEFPQVSSHRDLLDPIPNALPLLKADDQRLAQNGGTRTAQVVIGGPSSPSPPSRRWRLCPRRAASPSSSSSPSPPPSLSRVPMRQQRASPRMPFSHAVAACQTQAREGYGTRAGAKFVDARLPDRLFLLEAVKKRGAAKPDFSPKRPSRPKPSPTPSRTTTNPDGMFHKLRSRLQLRPTWPKPF